MISLSVNETFAHSWQAELLEARPLIAPPRHFTYPREADEVERGALEIIVHPASGDKFLATCALGFADAAAPTGIWACPDPDVLCAVAGGYAYLIETSEPQRFEQVEYRPVLEVRALELHGLLLFAGHHSLAAYGRDGLAWQTARLSCEGVAITSVEGWTLRGRGWDLMTDRNVEFAIDLKTGERLS